MMKTVTVQLGITDNNVMVVVGTRSVATKKFDVVHQTIDKIFGDLDGAEEELSPPLPPETTKKKTTRKTIDTDSVEEDEEL